MYTEPIRIHQLTLRNRIVMPPMAMGKATDGAPGENLVEYYRARANGTALIIVEHEYIRKQGIAHPGQLSMEDDTVIPAYRRLTEAVHGQGAKIFAQLSHAGAKAKDTGMPIVAPSAVAVPNGGIPSALTQGEIKEIIQAFADATVRVRQAGFDGVEIHSAHGYLLNQFYSPIMNHRTDEYSIDTMENRTRIQREVIQAVRKAAGDDFTIAIRFGACDYMEGGSEIADIPAAIHQFESAGVDLIDISVGMVGYLLPGHSEPGYLKELGLAAKPAASVPILLTGGVTKPEEAEALLQERAADLIGVGRALMKDADWTVRALQEAGVQKR